MSDNDVRVSGVKVGRVSIRTAARKGAPSASVSFKPDSVGMSNLTAIRMGKKAAT